jgi:signal transduction histidine kinase
MFAILARQSGVAMENARLYTELKENVRQIEESQRALVQAEKMAAVGRLIASLAHEINNPLQAVRNCLHLAARNDIDPEQRRSYLTMTDSELDRLVNTVRRLLDFSRPGGIEKEPVDVPAMINRIFALLKPQLQAQDIKLSVTYTGYAQAVFGAQDQLQQVFLNLILNSMDAMEEQKVSREIWLDIVFESRQIRFVVEDSGPGLPTGLHERVFEPFISSKKNGTGLGLAVSYGIVENHHGSMSIVAPRHKHGACFEIILPVGGEVDDGKNINS